MEFDHDSFADALLSWHEENPRPLPWKDTADAYRIWLSEIILQQTQVSQGIPYYHRFIKSYPTVEDLASATEDEVLNHWQGLGYNSRARNLHRAAKSIVQDHGGQLPTSYNDLLELKGIGSYTAAAIASFAFGERIPVIDANVIRILCRWLGIQELSTSTTARRQINAFLQLAISNVDPATFNQAIMNFGALQCKPKTPLCSNCPISEGCFAYKHDLQRDLPRKKQKAPRQERFFHFLEISNDHGMILEKRTSRDIWQGMYQLPLIESPRPGRLSSDEIASAVESMGIITDQSEIVHTDTQTLSHQKLLCTFYACDAVSDIDKFREKEGPLFVPYGNLSNFAVPKVIDCYFRVKSIFL